MKWIFFASYFFFFFFFLFPFSSPLPHPPLPPGTISMEERSGFELDGKAVLDIDITSLYHFLLFLLAPHHFLCLVGVQSLVASLRGLTHLNTDALARRMTPEDLGGSLASSISRALADVPPADISCAGSLNGE